MYRVVLVEKHDILVYQDCSLHLGTFLREINVLVVYTNERVHFDKGNIIICSKHVMPLFICLCTVIRGANLPLLPDQHELNSYVKVALEPKDVRSQHRSQLVSGTVDPSYDFRLSL